MQARAGQGQGKARQGQCKGRVLTCMRKQCHDTGGLDLTCHVAVHFGLQLGLLAGHNLPTLAHKAVQEVQIPKVSGAQHLSIGEGLDGSHNLGLVPPSSITTASLRYQVLHHMTFVLMQQERTCQPWTRETPLKSKRGTPLRSTRLQFSVQQFYIRANVCHLQAVSKHNRCVAKHDVCVAKHNRCVLTHIVWLHSTTSGFRAHCFCQRAQGPPSHMFVSAVIESSL